MPMFDVVNVSTFFDHYVGLDPEPPGIGKWRHRLDIDLALPLEIGAIKVNFACEPLLARQPTQVVAAKVSKAIHIREVGAI